MTDANVALVEDWMARLPDAEGSTRPSSTDAEAWAQLRGTYQIQRFAILFGGDALLEAIEFAVQLEQHVDECPPSTGTAPRRDVLRVAIAILRYMDIRGLRHTYSH